MDNHKKRLTARQAQVLDGLAQGYTIQQIAQRLGLSPRTVKDYLDRLKHRFAARSLEQLVAKATLNALLSGDSTEGD